MPEGYVIDLRNPYDATEWVTLGQDGYLLPPGGFALGVTRERVQVPNHICAFVAGRSGVARIGLQIEAAGLLDPGYKGCPTLELFNQAPYPIRLYAGMPIGQVYFVAMTTEAARPYGHKERTSKYQGDAEATASQMWRETTA
jgi:dCTP deaminase